MFCSRALEGPEEQELRSPPHPSSHPGPLAQPFNGLLGVLARDGLNIWSLNIPGCPCLQLSPARLLL